jgi:phosphoserine phosphatase
MSSNQELSQEVGRLIRNARAFCFDVDSTVITKEGIDELAAFKGVGKEVADLTSQ